MNLKCEMALPDWLMINGMMEVGEGRVVDDAGECGWCCRDWCYLNIFALFTGYRAISAKIL